MKIKELINSLEVCSTVDEDHYNCPDCPLFLNNCGEKCRQKLLHEAADTLCAPKFLRTFSESRKNELFDAFCRELQYLGVPTHEKDGTCRHPDDVLPEARAAIKDLIKSYANRRTEP